MALTQEQVDWWFSQNPTATAEQVAEAVKGAGGLDANAGLADMIANRYQIAPTQVTDYYAQQFGPDVFTPTTNEELISSITEQPAVVEQPAAEAAPTLADLKKMYAEKGATTQRITQSGDAGDVIDYLTNDLGGGFSAREDRPIIGYEGQGMDATPIYGDAVLSGFMQSKDGMDYFYDPEGVFQGSQKSQKADTFWDTFGPMIMAAMTMGGGGAMLGNSLFGLTGQAAAGAGGALAGGVNAALTDQDILAGALQGGVSSAGAMKLGDTGITLGDVNKAINLAQNPNLAGAANLFAPSVGSTQIGDTGISLNDVLKGLNTVQALGSGNDKQIFDAVTGLAKTYGSSGVASSTEPAITTLSDEDLAELKLRNQPGELQTYQDGGVQGLADFRKDMRLLNSLTTSGRTGDDMGGGTIDEIIKDSTTTTTEATTPADTSGTTSSDTTDLGTLLDEVTATGPNTDSGLSNQDILDMTNVTDNTVVVKGDKPLDYLPTDDDFVPTIKQEEVVVTGGRPTGVINTDTTGLDEGPIIPTGGTGNDGLETVTVTGGTGNDTITGGDGNDSVTGGTGNDTVEELVVTDKKCDPGYVYDEDLKQCVPIQTTEDTVTGGTGNDDIEELVVTDKKCQPGFVYDEDLKQCVPIVTTPVVNPPVVKPPVVKPPVVKPPAVIPTTTPVYTPSGYYGATETNEPVYAGGMSDFNLLATLQELLAEEPVKKDTKKSKDKTKMATGGHLDDLLAEQMTVDDLLKLLR